MFISLKVNIVEKFNYFIAVWPQTSSIIFWNIEWSIISQYIIDCVQMLIFINLNVKLSLKIFSFTFYPSNLKIFLETLLKYRGRKKATQCRGFCKYYMDLFQHAANAGCLLCSNRRDTVKMPPIGFMGFISSRPILHLGRDSLYWL